MIINGTQLRRAVQITLARIGQPILAFGIMQAFQQSTIAPPTLFPVFWGLSHTGFVFFMGLIISAQNHAVQSKGNARLAIFSYIALRVVALACGAGCVFGLVAFWFFGDAGWSVLLALYIASSALNASHNTLHELAGRRNRSIWVNWIWIGVLVFAVVGFGALNMPPLQIVTSVILFRMGVISLSLFQLLRPVDRRAGNARMRERLRHGAEFGLNMAVETSAFPILMYAALVLGGSVATDAIYAFSVEANFLFISMTGVFQQATLHLGETLPDLRARGNGRGFLVRNIVHVLASAVLILGVGVGVLAVVGSNFKPAYWALVYGAVLVMAMQTLAVSWARVLDLTRMITLTALPSTFLVFVGATLVLLWVGLPPRLAITLGVVIDGLLVGFLLLWLIQRALSGAKSSGKAIA